MNTVSQQRSNEML